MLPKYLNKDTNSTLHVIVLHHAIKMYGANSRYMSLSNNLSVASIPPLITHQSTHALFAILTLQSIVWYKIENTLAYDFYVPTFTNHQRVGILMMTKFV